MNQLIKKQDIKTQELSVIEQVVMQGDLSKLNPEQRVTYYKKVCESSGLNPFTRPFDYIMLNGKLTLYAKKDATEQLRKLNGISIESLDSQIMDDLYIVKATAKTKDGRTDQATGAVTLGNLKGDAKANAIMKAETKAKRRVTLSISGMGWTDETEIESIPSARPIEVDLSTGEIKKGVVLEAQAKIVPVITTINEAQIDELQFLIDECDLNYRNWFFEMLRKQYKSDQLSSIHECHFEKMKTAATSRMHEYHARQAEEFKDKEALMENVQ